MAAEAGGGGEEEEAAVADSSSLGRSAEGSAAANTKAIPIGEEKTKRLAVAKAHE